MALLRITVVGVVLAETTCVELLPSVAWHIGALVPHDFANVTVMVVTPAPVVILNALSFPATKVQLVVHTGAFPENTSWPFTSTSKFGRPLLLVVATANNGDVPLPTTDNVAHGVVVPMPRNGFVAVVSTLNTVAPAAFMIENALVTFVAVFISSPPKEATAFDITVANLLVPYALVEVPIPTKPVTSNVVLAM